MKLKIKIAAVVAALVIVCGSFTACGGSDDNGNTLVYGSSDYTAINPALFEHGEINLLLFAGLTAHDENNKVVPGLAEEWSFDKATNTYKFTLREGLTFHDGEPLTAEDVKFTIDSIMNPDNASENASNFEDVTGIKVVDDLHVNISLKAPNTAMLDYLTIGILPKHLLEGEDMATADFNTNPVGAGPYKLTEWNMGQSIKMEKFDDYYKDVPKIDNIEFKIVEDTDARAMQLESGEIDLAQITPKTEDRFKDNDDYRVYEMVTADYRGIMYNFNNSLWKENPELPKALSYAVDRDAIIDTVLLGLGEKAYSPLQRSEYCNKDIEKYEYNPDKACELIESAGWSKNSDGIYEKGGKTLSFTINCSQGDQVRVDMAKVCAQNFKDIGVEVSVKSPAEIDWAGQEAFLIGWGSPFDPDDHTYKVFGTDKGANYNGYSNEKIDSILQEARETEDNSKRIELYKGFQQELAADPAYTFIAYVDAIYVANSNISGITEDTVLGHHGVGIFHNIDEWEIN